MHQDDPDQLQRALHAFFDRTLARSPGRLPYGRTYWQLWDGC
jgi:hypothetical protein